MGTSLRLPKNFNHLRARLPCPLHWQLRTLEIDLDPLPSSSTGCPAVSMVQLLYLLGTKQTLGSGYCIGLSSGIRTWPFCSNTHKHIWEMYYPPIQGRHYLKLEKTTRKTQITKFSCLARKSRKKQWTNLNQLGLTCMHWKDRGMEWKWGSALAKQSLFLFLNFCP